MNNIHIDKNTYDSLKEFNTPNGAMSSEADFLKTNYNNKDYLFKKLHNDSKIVIENKLYIANMLDKYKDILPSNFILPDALVYVDDSFKGFNVPYVEGTNLEVLLKDKTIKDSIKIDYLKKLGDILDKLDEIRNTTELKSIYLNDLHASNFIVDFKKNRLSVIDLDSCKIGNSHSSVARYMTPFSLLNYSKDKYNIKDDPIFGYVDANKESDLYCYTILFLNYLYGSNIGSVDIEDFYDYIDYLKILKFDRNLIDALLKIVSNEVNQNINIYLKYLREEQIKKANKEEFQKIKLSK